MTEPTQERRRHKRFIIEGMDVQCNMHFATDVQLLDISLGGAAILLDKQLTIGTSYALKVETGTDIVSLNASVVWAKLAGSRKDGNDIVPLYRAGLRFDHILTGKGAHLMSILSESMNDRKVKHRLTGPRVKFETSSSVLDYQKSYEVKRISKGGMLIETEQELGLESLIRMDLHLADDEPPIYITGRIASCIENPGMQPRTFSVGVEFLDLDQAQQGRINEFISMLESF